MAKYRSRPEIINAVVYELGMEDGIDFISLNGREIYCTMLRAELDKHPPTPRSGRRAFILTANGQCKSYLAIGDYIITNELCERYPCSKDIFEFMYERVND